MCKRIIALISCFVICFSLLCPVAHAEFESDSYVYTTTTFDDALITASYFLGGQFPIWSPVFEGLAHMVSPNEVCPMSDSKRHSGEPIRLLGFGERGGSFGGVEGSYSVLCLCDYCGYEFTVDVSADELADAFGQAYDDYVNDLPTGLTSNNTGTTAFGAVGVDFADTDNEVALSKDFFKSIDLYSAANAASNGQALLINKFGSSKFFYLFKRHSSHFGKDMLILESSTSLNGSFTSANYPLGTFVTSSSSPSADSSNIFSFSSSYGNINKFFLCYEDAYEVYKNKNVGVHYLRSDSYICPEFSIDSDGWVFVCRVYNLGFISSTGIVSVKNEYLLFAVSASSYGGRSFNPPFPATVDVGMDYDSSTRVSNVTNIFNEYNTTNNFTENNVVNYYIGTVDESNNVTNIYNTNIYNEDTLVFSEPVTGAQIQTTGWSYDYDTRSYDIKLTAGSFAMSGTDVTRIVATYGDEALTLTYYDSSNTALATDTYSYVLVAKEECTLNGHTNTVETILEASCSSGGQYKNVCSVCGHEELFSMDPLGHTFNYTVLREPSCDVAGLGFYSCTACGTEYTESIDPLAHAYRIVETVDATYDEDGNKLTAAYTRYACTVCGAEYIDYTGDGVITDDSGHWSWLKKWLMEFKEWLGDLLGGISVEGGDTIYNDYETGIDISGDTNHDYDITYEDQNGEQQKTTIKDLIGKFAFVKDIYTIGDTLITAVTSDAAMAYELDNTTSESDYSIMTDGVPKLTVNLGAAESKYGYTYGGKVTVLDLSWYAPYKETVDNLLSGFLWLLFLWHLFKTAPSILGGVGLTTEHLQDISRGEKGHKRGGSKK